MSVHVALEELGVEYDLHEVNMKNGDHKKPEFLKINPRGQVGVLKTPDGVLTENAAMIVYLNDKHKGKLIPKDGFERAKALQWLMYANSTLHPAYAKVMFAERNDADENVIEAGCKDVQAQWDLIEKQLSESGGKYLCGDKLTAGDIYVTVVANWDFIPTKPKFGPKTKAFLKAVSSLPSYQRAIADEHIEYKAAA